MPQHDMSVANDTGANVRTDINNALAALVASSSGASAPATTFAYMLWADTTTGLLKIRNGANAAWITLCALAGGQVVFPATQNASADANTLDDYEEGTWTPAIDRVTTPVTTTYVSRSGTYTKVGRKVTAHAAIAIDTISAAGSGNNKVTGLPFTPGATSYGNGVVSLNNGFSATSVRVCFVEPSDAAIYFSAAGPGTSKIAENFASGYIIISITYEV